MKPALNLHCRVQDLFKSEDQVKHAGRVTLAILDFLHDCVVVKSDTVILYNDLNVVFPAGRSHNDRSAAFSAFINAVPDRILHQWLNT